MAAMQNGRTCPSPSWMCISMIDMHITPRFNRRHQRAGQPSRRRTPRPTSPCRPP